MKIPTIAIVGRPNVGKSTLFNRLVGERLSIVEDVPGVTRDRLYARGEWLGQPFNVIDTGGIEIENTPFMDQIRFQAQVAIDEADIIVMVSDIRAGMTNDDLMIASILNKSDKPVFLAINKVDNPEQRLEVFDFYQLGLGDPYPVSSSHGLGLGDLLDDVFAKLPIIGDEENEEHIISFCLIGRPNVGKSSLVNKILGEDRVIVSDIAGTTRDAIHTYFRDKDGNEFKMVDTAGIRRRGKVEQGTEKYSVLRSMRAIEESDIVLIVINAEEGIREQDKRIAGLAHDEGKGVIIVVNKWDAIEKDTHTMKKFETDVREEFKYLSYAPILFVSALSGQRVLDIMPKLLLIHQERIKRINSSLLNNLLLDAVAMNPTPTDKGRRLKIFYITQVAIKPPTFVVFVNDKELMHFSYIRFLDNQIRERFGFKGTPIRLITRERK
ncbi:ribosome biogenesis GTPase Der [Atopobacter phocae]|uniref:ribosome biogenesis GTPase Der n=1 Tax=Atopobacter phocae TaxID=136492 RepID=UPI00046F0C01|nr:ribosome biogenesis GTPase Der [Atopobacter phocae]